MVKVYDDFLSKRDYKNLFNNMTSVDLPWHWGDFIIENEDLECDELDNYQMHHTMFMNSSPQNQSYNWIVPIISDPRLECRALVKIKANLNNRSSEIIRHGFHCDVPYHCTTAIFYLNTNNGYTEFEDGTKVDSISNRLVTFPSSIRHTGTTCTDQKRRLVINFNYFSAPIDENIKFPSQYASNN